MHLSVTWAQYIERYDVIYLFKFKRVTVYRIQDNNSEMGNTCKNNTQFIQDFRHTPFGSVRVLGFTAAVSVVRGHRGRNVALLASGDSDSYAKFARNCCVMRYNSLCTTENILCSLYNTLFTITIIILYY